MFGRLIPGGLTTVFVLTWNGPNDIQEQAFTTHNLKKFKISADGRYVSVVGRSEVAVFDTQPFNPAEPNPVEIFKRFGPDHLDVVGVDFCPLYGHCIVVTSRSYGQPIVEIFDFVNDVSLMKLTEKSLSSHLLLDTRPSLLETEARFSPDGWHLVFGMSVWDTDRFFCFAVVDFYGNVKSFVKFSKAQDRMSTVEFVMFTPTEPALVVAKASHEGYQFWDWRTRRKITDFTGIKFVDVRTKREIIGMPPLEYRRRRECKTAESQQHAIDKLWFV